MQGHRAFLGAVVDLMDVNPQGTGEACIAPKDSSRRQVAMDITQALADGNMSTAQAAKTRGRSTWVGTNSFGKLGRLGLSVLKHLQYHRQRHLSLTQRRSLQFHRHVIMIIPPKRMRITTRPEDPAIMYSDAEYEPESGRLPKLGWVLFPGRGQRPIGQAMELPEKIWATWGHRKQQIFPAEAIALPLATWALHAHLRGRDIIWFVDNESAASCAIRGGSKLPEVETAVQVAHLLWVHLGCRVWIEWVDSISNPSDGLSRLGLQDPWTRLQDWSLSEPCHPPWHETTSHPDDTFQALWSDIGGCEGLLRHWEDE